MCVFNGVFMRSGPDFSLLLDKIFLVASETECWTKLFPDSHVFLKLFSPAFSLILFHLCPPQALAKYF